MILQINNDLYQVLVNKFVPLQKPSDLEFTYDDWLYIEIPYRFDKMVEQAKRENPDFIGKYDEDSEFYIDLRKRVIEAWKSMQREYDADLTLQPSDEKNGPEPDAKEEETISIYTPFSWLQQNAWYYMQQTADEIEFDEVYELYQFLAGEITAQEFFIEKKHKMTSQADLRQRFAQKLPEIMAQSLEGLALMIRDKQIKFKLDIDEL